MKDKVHDSLYRINNAKYFLIDEDGNEKKVEPRSSILFDDSVLFVISRLDRKIYCFIGTQASAKKQFALHKMTSDLSLKLGYQIDRIRFPSEKIPYEYLQFIEFLTDDDYRLELRADKTKYYACYFCGEPLEREMKVCTACKKEILFCIVCKLPISFGDDLGKCSLCEGLAHFVHFHEWVKVMGKCPKCFQNIPLEAIVLVTKELK